MIQLNDCAHFSVMGGRFLHQMETAKTWSLLVVSNTCSLTPTYVQKSSNFYITNIYFSTAVVQLLYAAVFDDFPGVRVFSGRECSEGAVPGQFLGRKTEEMIMRLAGSLRQSDQQFGRFTPTEFKIDRSSKSIIVVISDRNLFFSRVQAGKKTLELFSLVGSYLHFPNTKSELSLVGSEQATHFFWGGNVGVIIHFSRVLTLTWYSVEPGFCCKLLTGAMKQNRLFRVYRPGRFFFFGFWGRIFFGSN